MPLFEIPELDYMATKRKLMKAMDKYDWCLMRIDAGMHPKITQSFTMDTPSGGNEFNSKTENAAIFAAEGYQVHEVYVKRVADCINNLRPEYREIAVYSLINQLQDIEAAEKVGLSYSNYSLKKREVIKLMAYGLGAEVYLKESKTEVK